MAFISDGGTAMLTNFLMITFMLCVDSKLIQNQKKERSVFIMQKMLYERTKIVILIITTGIIFFFILFVN